MEEADDGAGTFQEDLHHSVAFGRESIDIDHKGGHLPSWISPPLGDQLRKCVILAVISRITLAIITAKGINELERAGDVLRTEFLP